MAPRDGLQAVNRSASIPLDSRVALIEALQSAHLPYIEAGAFVSERRVPAMADTAELLARCAPYDGELAALVPNIRHYERFAAGTAGTVALFVSASEEYSQKNTRMSVDQALAAAREVAVAAIRDGFALRAHVSGAFRTLGEDDQPVQPGNVERVCARLREMNATMAIALADTDGRATNEDMERIFGHIDSRIGLDGIGAHIHDRAGNGIGKARAAWDAGVRMYDSAAGGIGGNPTALADAVGNLATEELVRMLTDLGAETGIDWDRLIDAGAIITRMTEFVGDPAPPSTILAAALTERRDT